MNTTALAMYGNIKLLCKGTDNFGNLPSTSDGARMFLDVEDISKGKTGRTTTRFDEKKRIREVSFVQF